MKIKTLSAFILSAAFTLPAIAESPLSATTVFGADYIQAENITGKTIQNVLSTTGECDIENRDFTTSSEIRVFSNSKNSSECYEFLINNVITESTFTNTGYVLGSDRYEYAPGIPVIIESMSVGEIWNQTSSVTLNDADHGIREDILTLETIEDVSVAAENFTECLKINWTIDYSYKANQDINLWLCPELGVVKYEYVGSDNSWELQDYTLEGEEPITVSGADYIQSSAITFKMLQDVNSSTGECNIEERTYAGNNETRRYSNSTNGQECFETYFRKNITASTLDYTGFSTEGNFYVDGSDQTGYFSYDESYNPGLPIIINQMVIGESWGYRTSDVNVKYREEFDGEEYEDEFYYQRYDTFTLLGIETVNTAAGVFEECLKIYWDSADSLDYELQTYLWFCPDIGLVKYRYAGYSENWEMQEYSTEPSTSKSSSGGGGGGGSLPISILTIIGLVAIRRRH